MTFEISFPDQPASEASALARELRLALLQSGVDPKNIEIQKRRADTMDLGAAIQVMMGAYHAAGPMLEQVMPALTAVHFARILYEVCAPAHSGVSIKTAAGVIELKAGEISIANLKKILEATNSYEPSS
jgi:hypothetical protein